jgi:hypothetical protein
MASILGPVRSVIVDGCEVVLTALLYWQAVDAPRPVTVIVTGLVLAVRKAALLPRRHGNDAADRM